MTAMENTAPPVVSLSGIRKSFNVGEPNETEVLHGVDLALDKGRFVAVMGPSGSGKSTLLNIVGLLDRPTAGSLEIQGQETTRLDEAALTRLRGHTIGFVFQYHHLITAFSALENVMMPILGAQGFASGEATRRAADLLARVGLAPWARQPAGRLSGGQQQRVAVARALVGSPLILLADEPTGNLDSKNGEAVMELMSNLHKEGATICMVTHDPRYALHAERTIHLFDGRVVEEQVGEGS
jgi:lipoprotein-releasing system ATP-binding protein